MSSAVGLDGPPAEPAQVGVAGMGAQGHARAYGQADGAVHHRGVAGVESAGHVRGGDEGEQLGIGAHGPGPETLAHVRVEVDARHGCVSPGLYHAVFGRAPRGE